MTSKVSVIIPTHQPIFLERTLQSLVAQRGVEKTDFEVLVVENPQSTITVEQLVAKYQGELQLVHLICQKQGANAARNYGSERAESPLLCYTDDDCEVAPTWISTILGFYGLYPSTGIVGGHVALKFLSKAPRWIVMTFRQWLSEVNLGAEAFDIAGQPGKYLVSANLAVRKKMWQTVGGFPEFLGYVGRDQLRPNDEPLFIERCGGYGTPRVVYFYAMQVSHLIAEGRCTIDYFKKRAYGQGVADAQQQLLLNPEDSVDDIYHNVFQHHWLVSMNQNDLMYARNLIAHEESMRLFLRNLIICKTEFFRGVNEVLNNAELVDHWQRQSW